MTGGIGAALTQSGVSPSPFQQSLASYGRGQGEVAGASAFQGGPGVSTNETQVAGVGPAMGQAQALGQASLADTAALQNYYNQQFGQLASGLGGILGKAGSGGGGGGGTTGGISSLPSG